MSLAHALGASSWRPKRGGSCEFQGELGVVEGRRHQDDQEDSPHDMSGTHGHRRRSWLIGLILNEETWYSLAHRSHDIS
jgi:hypothetical protein